MITGVIKTGLRSNANCPASQALKTRARRDQECIKHFFGVQDCSENIKSK